MNVALHIHTLYSACAETKLEEIGDYCREQGISVLGVTDHDTIAGALCLRESLSDIRIIVGEEIHTREGEIVGLFLEEEIPPRLDPLETCERIKEQGGLVYIPHPFDPFKIHRLKTPALRRVLDMVDIMEVFNAKGVFRGFNSIALRFAEKHGLAKAVGSDAHYLEAIGLCMNEMADFQTPQEFLANLRSARLTSRRANPLRTWYVGVKNVLRTEGHSLKRFKRR